MSLRLDPRCGPCLDPTSVFIFEMSESIEISGQIYLKYGSEHLRDAIIFLLLLLHIDHKAGAHRGSSHRRDCLRQCSPDRYVHRRHGDELFRVRSHGYRDGYRVECAPAALCDGIEG